MSGLYEGTGASSSGCEACDQPYLLELDELYMKAGKAVVVFNGIMVFVLLACLATTSRFAWTKNDWPARGRTEAYVVAVVAGTIYFLLSTIEGAMSWAVVETTLKFIVFDVFLDVSYRISDLFILAVVFGLIQSRVVVVHPVKWLILLVLGLLTSTAFALDTASTAILLRYGLSYGTNARVNNLTFDSEYVQLAYLAIYVVATMILFVFRVVFVLDDRSKSSIMLIPVAGALFVRAVIDLTNTSYVVWLNHYNGAYDDTDLHYYVRARLNLADEFVYVFMTWFIFLGVALIAMTRDNIPRDKHRGGMAPVAEEVQYM